MSEATIEALESEAYEGEGEAYGEAGYEGEAFGEAGYEAYGEDARSDARRRRARQQQIIAARQRQARLRRPPAPPPRRPAVTVPGQRRDMTAIRSADLDMKAELDALRRQLNKAKRSGNMAMYSSVAGAVVSQGIDTYGDSLAKHEVVKALLRTAPLALLWPQSGRRGIEAVLLHPAFLGAAGVTAIFVSGKLMTSSRGVHDIQLKVPDTLQKKGTLRAVAVDRNGKDLVNKVTWDTPDTEYLDLQPDGSYKAIKDGDARIRATADGFTKSIWAHVPAP